MEGIEVKNLNKSYKDKKVLEDISLKIDKPGVYLVAGPNGSGKTTLLEILTGLRKADSGEISINGGKHNTIGIKKDLGFLSQQNTLRKNSTVREELNLVKDLFNIDMDEYEYLKRFNLEEYYYKRTKQLSGGTKRRLLIAMIFMANQKIVILDEPVSGLDTFSRDEIWNMISEYSQRNIVIVSDHYLNQAAKYSDYIYLIDKGKIILSNTSDNIRKTCRCNQIIKVRKEYFHEVENEVSKRYKDYEVRVSGTVYNIFVNERDLEDIKHIEGVKFTTHSIDFEDIYFYHTGNYSTEEEVNYA